MIVNEDGAIVLTTDETIAMIHMQILMEDGHTADCAIETLLRGPEFAVLDRKFWDWLQN